MSISNFNNLAKKLEATHIASSAERRETNERVAKQVAEFEKEAKMLGLVPSQHVKFASSPGKRSATAKKTLKKGSTYYRKNTGTRRKTGVKARNAVSKMKERRLERIMQKRRTARLSKLEKSRRTREERKEEEKRKAEQSLIEGRTRAETKRMKQSKEMKN